MPLLFKANTRADIWIKVLLKRNGKGSTEILETVMIKPQMKRQQESQRLCFTLTPLPSAAACGALTVKVCVSVFVCLCNQK